MSLLVNHIIPLEEGAKVYCASMKPALLMLLKLGHQRKDQNNCYTVASCDHSILRYMSRIRWLDKISNEKSEEGVRWRTLNKNWSCELYG